MQNHTTSTEGLATPMSAQRRRTDSRRRQTTRAKYWEDVYGVLHIRRPNTVKVKDLRVQQPLKAMPWLPPALEKSARDAAEYFGFVEERP